MASSKVADYARKMREKKLAEVRTVGCGAIAEKRGLESGGFLRLFFNPVRANTLCLPCARDATEKSAPGCRITEQLLSLLSDRLPREFLPLR